jgi:hypothetical protein
MKTTGYSIRFLLITYSILKTNEYTYLKNMTKQCDLCLEENKYYK